MPRSVATRVKGGASRTRRIRYTFREKINFLSALLDMQQSKGISLRSAATVLQISHQNLSRWKRNDDAIINNSKSFSNKKSIAEGPVGELDSVKEDLLHWIFELREMGHAVDRFMVVIKSCVLLPDLVEKGERAIYKIATRFLARFSLVYRMGTKESQRPPHEVAGEALDFIENARARLVGRDPRFIINMDQTPVYFSMHSKKTLSKIGLRTVPILTSTNDTRRVTVAATITASGDQLLPMVIFKGSPTGTIAKTEIPLFDPTSIYDVQKNAWMDERVMKHWVDQVLQPYVATAPDDVIPVLLLDSYRCHIMGSIVNKITSLGVEVIHIPGGCTGLVQPLDVGFNRPFKVRIRRKWQTWMMETVQRTGTVKPPERADVSAWIADTFWDMDANPTIIKNAWMKTGYEWFKN